MKNSLFGILIFLGLLFTYACDEDSFSQVVEIDVPEHTPRLVLNSIVDDGGQEILADISISRGILDDAEGLLISDATIRLLSDKGLIGIADYDPNLNKYRWSKTGAEIRGAEEVQISADANGYLSVNATDVWPTKVSLSSVRVEQDGGISLDGYVNDLIEVTFQDPPGEENYYALDAFIDFEYFYVEPNGDTMRFADANHLYMDTNDPLIGYSNNYGLIFTDAAFDGKEVKIE
nr:DUF4249 domain-containing protein [Saprospiraceae bacterium]